MTREEAKRVLEFDLDHKHNDESKEALRIAIKALKPEPCDDAISRQEAIELFFDDTIIDYTGREVRETIKDLPSVIPSRPTEPCSDAISRQAAVNIASGFCHHANIADELAKLPSVKPQDSKTEQFAKWVASEIFDDNWEYNKDAFDELACRKLAKLGIVRAKGDEWELIESQESEDKECK